MTTYAVVTAVPEGNVGNLALVYPLYVETEPGLATPLEQVPELGMLLLNLRAPVFTLGEMLVLDRPGGREVNGKQRKPSKWDITTEEFASIKEAVKRAQEITT